MNDSSAFPKMTYFSSLEPDSPCVGKCSTAYGDDVCKGCGRTYLEVINWIIFTEEEKAAVRARLKKEDGPACE